MTKYQYGKFIPLAEGEAILAPKKLVEKSRELKLEVLLDTGDKIEVKRLEPCSHQVVINDLRDNLSGEDKVIAYRWNDHRTSRYVGLQSRLGNRGIHTSLDLIENIIEEYSREKSGTYPDFHSLYGRATGRKLTDRQERELAEWFSHPRAKRSVGFNHGNCVLAAYQIKNNPSGRRVICPNGHTLAYNVAKRIYEAITEKRNSYYPGELISMPNWVQAREFTGVSRYRMTDQKVTMHRKGAYITIGCQRIPFSAIFDLAKREGWDKES